MKKLVCLLALCGVLGATGVFAVSEAQAARGRVAVVRRVPVRNLIRGVGRFALRRRAVVVNPVVAVNTFAAVQVATPVVAVQTFVPTFTTFVSSGVVGVGVCQ